MNSSANFFYELHFCNCKYLNFAITPRGGGGGGEREREVLLTIRRWLKVGEYNDRESARERERQRERV
jgi:hypothetical protein